MAGRQAGKAFKQPASQAGRQTRKCQSVRQAGRHAFRQASMHACRCIQAGRLTGIWVGRQAGRQAGRQGMQAGRAGR